MSAETYIYRSYIKNYPSYIKKLGTACVVTELLDNRIISLTEEALFSRISPKEVSRKIQPAVGKAQSVIDTINPLAADIRLSDYFRLVAHTRFATEMALAPVVFAGNDMEARQEIVDGTTGIAAQIASEALSLYIHADQNDDELRSQARGVINEYSAIALANFTEDGAHIALPSSQYLDLYCGVDALYYSRQNASRAAELTTKRQKASSNFRTRVQIKTRDRYQRAQKSQDVATILANDFGNDGSFADGFSTTQLLINEMDGIDTVNNQRKILTSWSKNIEKRLNSQQNRLNTGALLPYRTKENPPESI